MTNGLLSPFTTKRLSNLAMMMLMIMPVMYMVSSIRAECLNNPGFADLENAVMMMMYTGNRAEHDMNGIISMVMSRDLRSSIVRVAIMAGMLQPKPIIIGMNDLPCNPMRCMILSIMKAALAM